MPFITPEQAATLEGTTVRAAVLVEMQFASRTVRVWNGAARTVIAGETWEGLGILGSIGGLEQTRQAAAKKLDLTLSGIDEALIASAVANRADVKGRPFAVWQQLFDADWQPIGSPIPLVWGTMERVVIAEDTAHGTTGGTLVAKIECENQFSARARTSARRFTDTDHRRDYPDDPFFEFVSQQRTLTWP